MKNATEETDIGKALFDPSSQFSSPLDIPRHPSLKPEVKRKILCQWEADERQLLVAEDEGMKGAKESRLDEIRRAIGQLRENSRLHPWPSRIRVEDTSTEARVHLSGPPAAHRFA